MADEWIKTLADCRGVKFTHQELGEKAFHRSGRRQQSGLFHRMFDHARNPLSREEVESHFEGELSKFSAKPKLSLLRLSWQTIVRQRGRTLFKTL
jgi:hypothetical protein